MASSQAPYRGAVQAQGSDITKKGGYTRSWAEDKPITDEEGLSFLDKIKGECTKSQQAIREMPFKRARRFIKGASSLGGVLPEAQPKSFYYRENDKKYSSIRVDIEIHAGLTFIPVEQVE